MTRSIRAALGAVLAIAASGTMSRAQELEPRLWSNLPVGTNFLGASYGFSTGNIVVNPALPLQDVDARVGTVAVRYVRALDLGGLSGSFAAIVPWASGNWEGILEGQPADASRSGPADPRVRLMVNFLGAPALRGAEFAKYRPKTVSGASLQIILPLGDYNASHLINIGSNRYTFCPEVGFSHTFGRTAVEVTGSAWFFTDNDDFFGGRTLEQDPLYALQVHLFYTFKPGLWVGVDAGAADGGETFVDGQSTGTIDKNTRYGVTLSVPIDRRQGLKLSVSTGLTTRIGADFTSYGVGYQYMWGGT
jgi:hypothetical protein